MDTTTTQQTTPHQWLDVRNPLTGRLIARYCPQTHQLEHMDKGKRGVIDLPAEKREKANG